MYMKVKFLKNHLAHKAKDVVEDTEDRCQYWINCGVAEEVKKKVKKHPKTKKGAISKK